MNITIISSSIRKGRTSHRVALALKKIIDEQNHVATILDLKEINIPLQDERYVNIINKSNELIKVSEMLKLSDAIIIVTPEYNGSITASLKNVLDVFGKPEFSAKAIGVATVSTGIMGGVRAAYQLQQIILALQAYPQPQMLLTPEVTKQLDEFGTILTDDYQKKINVFVNSFINFTNKVK